jgi:tRNA nucleotidyltransferase/poly(A) polymerase
LYSELLKYSGEKLNIYKEEMFKLLFHKSAGNMEKLAKELGINLTTFAKHNREYATEVTIATKNKDFADEILRNKAFYGLQMGSSEYFELQALVTQRNKDLTMNEAPIHSDREIEEIPPRYLFKA